MKKHIAALLLTLSTIALGQSSKYPSSSGGGSGTVTSVTAGSGLSGGTITDAGTINLITPVAVSNGGTGAASASAALTSLGAAAATRAINTTAPLSGGGNLTADRTLTITQAATAANGYLSSTDWNTFNGKAARGANADITSLSKIDKANGIFFNDGQVTPNYVQVAAPASVNTSYQLYWPVDAGTAINQPLVWNGAGQLSWGTSLTGFATTSYVNSQVSQLSSKNIATIVCATNITLSGTQTCDGVSVDSISGQIAFVIGQTDKTTNGIYCPQVSSWARCGQMPDNAFTAAGAIVTVATGGGTTYDQTVWYVNGDGTGALNAYQIPVTAGTRRPYADAGSCTVSSTTLSTTATNLTCTGVPASTAVAVNCSGSAAFSTPTGDSIYCRSTGTLNQIACNTVVANTQAMTFACSWVKP